MHRALAELFGNHDVVARRHHPDLKWQLDTARRTAEVRAVLPGVYAPAELAADWRTLARAVSVWDPNAVIVGETAAALSFWPRLQPRTVEVVTSRRQPNRPGYRFRLRTIPPDLIELRAQARYSHPALTVLDLIPSHGTDVIDRALRSRMVSLSELYAALELTPCRTGNVDRRRALIDSRGEPWSALERLAHRELYAAGIRAWHANVPIRCGGFTFHQDIAMSRCPLSIELDGYETHSSREAFEDDRRRGNHLLLAGRDVLHFTWLMVNDTSGYFVRTVAAALEKWG